ncbi:MAG: right-handed parallel beta-helix repeat-containing protein [Planctomycetes bacterium]|nr:right-handed parallel beta-helix repeat-containing protein [Planctomycetota bacterium]
MRLGRNRWWVVALAGFLMAVTACNRFDPARPVVFVPPPTTIGGGGVGVSSQIEIEYPLFKGLTEVVAGSTVVHLRWPDASDNNDAPADLRYRVYASLTLGDQDFTTPTLETAGGVTTATITGLTDGAPIYVVVRAVDLDDNEDPNTVEWLALPNPVRYLGGPGASASGDGLSPSSAFASMPQAFIALFGQDVNLYVAAGGYPSNVSLSDGQSLYGGFSGNFSFADRDPSVHVTEFSFTSPIPHDLVSLESGTLPIVFDGCVVSGNLESETGVKIDEVPFSVANCEIRDTTIHGVEILSDVVFGDSLMGTIRGCSIVRCLGEGIVINALGDLVIDDNQIVDNGNEGVESQWLYGISDETTRIVITRNVISRNGDEGVDLDFAEVTEIAPTLPSQGARIRAVLRSNEIRDNVLSGIQIDLDFENSDGVDFEARLEDNQVSGNHGGGLLLDGDARGAFRLARNVISCNRGAGITISGTPDGPWCRLLHCRILGNQGAGIDVTDHVGIEARYSLFARNLGGALRGTRAWIDVRNSVLLGNAVASDTDAIRYSSIFAEPVPSGADVGMVFADPLLENTPLLAEPIVSAASASEAIIVQVAAFASGDTIEIDDDGIARTVTAVLGDRIEFAPAFGRPTEPGDIVLRFAGNDVVEREGLSASSPAIDAGDPLETDRDGTVADLGPIGGDTPGNVGIETGLAVETPPTDMVGAAPLPSLLLTSPNWALRMRRNVTVEIANNVSLTLAGAPTPLVPVADPNPEVFAFTTPTAGLPDEVYLVELEPVTLVDLDAPERQPDHVELRYRVAALDTDADPVGSDANGTAATAQVVALPVSISGTVQSATDRDYYRVTLSGGDRLRTELISGRRELPLIGRLSITTSDGLSVLATASAAPPTTLDPLLDLFIAPNDGDYLVRVESAIGVGSTADAYELQLSVE